MPPSNTTTLSSTTAAVTLAPAHERREAREVDALLEAQRQRVIEKDEEVKRLKRHVHALSQHPPTGRKQTHAYLDRHKPAKAKKAVKKSGGDAKKGNATGKNKKKDDQQQQQGDDDEKPDEDDNGSSLHSTQQSNTSSSSIVTVDDDDDSNDANENESRQQQRQRDRAVDLYDQMAATLDQRIQSSDGGGSPSASQSHSPFTLASSVPESPRQASQSAELEQLTDALQQLQTLAAKQQQTISILQQQSTQSQSPTQQPRRTTSQQQQQQQQQQQSPQQPNPRQPTNPPSDSLWSTEVQSLLQQKYALEEQRSQEVDGRSERMREVRRVLKETIGNLEEKLDEVEKWKRAALQAETERRQAVEVVKKVAKQITQQQASKATNQSGRGGRRTAEEDDDEEQGEEDEEEEEEDEEGDEEEEDEPVVPQPIKRSSPVRSPAKSPIKAQRRVPVSAIAAEAKGSVQDEPAVAADQPASVYTHTAATARSSAAPPPPPITTHFAPATATSTVLGAPLLQSPTASVDAVSIATTFLSATQQQTTVTSVGHPTSQPSLLPSPVWPVPTLPSSMAAHFSPVQSPPSPPSAVIVEVAQGTLNPQFFLFSAAAPPPHTFLSCHLPPSPPSFSALFGGHSPAYRMMCQLPLPADVRQRVVVAMYAQVRGGAGGGGESAKVGEAELDLWSAVPAGGAAGTLQLWWEGDDKESMTAQERLIATLPYSIRPTTLLAVEESKQQLSYIDSYSTRVSASPPAPSSVRASRRSSLTHAPVLSTFTMTLTTASCSVVRLSRLQLRSQCTIADFNAPLTATPLTAASSSSSSTSTAATRCAHRLSVSLHCPIAQCVDALLRLHMSIDSPTAVPVGYFDVPLRPLLCDASGAMRSVGISEQQWSAVHEPGSDVHIGSIEYGLHWTIDNAGH